MSLASTKASKLGLVVHNSAEGVRYTPPCGLLRLVAENGVAIHPTEQIHYGRMNNADPAPSSTRGDIDFWDQRHR